jgi:Pentapeptide repeats (9 copies)
MAIIVGTPTTECAMDDAEFGDFADFSETRLGALLTCFGSKFGARANFKNTEIRKAKFDRSEFEPGLDLTGTSFGDISFKDVIFKGRCDFSNRAFRDQTNFAGAKFGEVPIFHDCELHQDTEFTCEESFPKRPAGTSEASRAYRTLKLAMNKHQATKEEQFFFRREMREERLVMWRSGDWRKQMRSVVYFFYEKLSDYGSSVLIPFLWLLSAWIVAAMLFSTTCSSTTRWVFRQNILDVDQTLRWLIYAIANGVPLFGFGESAKEMGRALGTDTSTIWFAMLLFLDKLLSLLFVFLIGLGLRNAFKMK